MPAQSRRPGYLRPNNLSLRATANWADGRGTETLISQPGIRDIFTTILATIGLGNVQEAETSSIWLPRPTSASSTGRRSATLIICRRGWPVSYPTEWNDLDAAEQHGRQSLHLARRYDRVIDRFVICEVFTARLKLAGDVWSVAWLAGAGRCVRQHNFVFQLPGVAAARKGADVASPEPIWLQNRSSGSDTRTPSQPGRVPPGSGKPSADRGRRVSAGWGG